MTLLFKQEILKGIKTGVISLAFRKWKRPTVKKGSLLKTSVGRLEIVDIKKTDQDKISNDEACKAGFKDLDSLLKKLNAGKDGQIYKIKVRYHSPDPRIALRQDDSFSDKELVELKKKLDRLDTYSRQGVWTREILETILENPQRKAADLASLTGREKDWLKRNIRKLKNLGLTVSHNPGYTLSPRGKAFLNKLKNN